MHVHFLGRKYILCILYTSHCIWSIYLHPRCKHLCALMTFQSILQPYQGASDISIQHVKMSVNRTYSVTTTFHGTISHESRWVHYWTNKQGTIKIMLSRKQIHGFVCNLYEMLGRLGMVLGMQTKSNQVALMCIFKALKLIIWLTCHIITS